VAVSEKFRLVDFVELVSLRFFFFFFLQNTNLVLCFMGFAG